MATNDPVPTTSSEPQPLATIDAGEFLHRCMDRMDFAQKILDCFRQQSVVYLQQMIDAVKQGQVEQAHRPAHTLKGASANLAAKQLAELAYQAEQAAAQHQGEIVGQLIEPIRQEIDRVLTAAPKALAELKPSSDGHS